MSHRARFHAGHFGFRRMKADGLREPHPFTIASAPSADGRISFVIRALGDYTTKLIAEVEPGMHADVYAPYGHFERKPDCEREIWIGGGVGISPFIAWMRDGEADRFEQVTLFYFFTPGRAFPDVSVLEAMARDRDIEFVPVSAGPSSEAFTRRFGQIAQSVDASQLDIAVCGPRGCWMRFAGPRAIMAFAVAPFATNCLPSDDLQAHRTGTKPSPSDLPDGPKWVPLVKRSDVRHPAILTAASATFALAAGCAQPSAPHVASAIPAEAAPISPEAKLGRNVAAQQCSHCHAIGLTGTSAVAEAPPLRDLYKRYAIEDLRGAFVRGIEVAHARMPTFRLSPRDVDNLLAYLRSIDPCAQPSTDEEAMARCFEPL